MAQPPLLGILPRPRDLKVIVVETGDAGIGKSCDLSSGTTDTATDVEDAHALFEADLGGEVVFVAGQLRDTVGDADTGISLSCGSCCGRLTEAAKLSPR